MAGTQTGLTIDFHQHTNYHGRSDEQLMQHQKIMGIDITVLLPAGTNDGLAVGAGSYPSVAALARSRPRQFLYFANEQPETPDAIAGIEKQLKTGARGIGEQKFHVNCDSAWITSVAEIAKEHRVPVLLHFQHETYNMGFERFSRVLEQFPTVNFIGHAQTFWAYIDERCDPAVLYPKGRVTAGGLTHRLLADYPNMYGDLSAGSGLNALLRDEDHARWFLERHQDRLIYGSDCDDTAGAGDTCSGAKQLAAIRRLLPDSAALRKILYGNAARLLRLDQA